METKNERGGFVGDIIATASSQSQGRHYAMVPLPRAVIQGSQFADRFLAVIWTPRGKMSPCNGDVQNSRSPLTKGGSTNTIAEDCCEGTKDTSLLALSVAWRPTPADSPGTLKS